MRINGFTASCLAIWCCIIPIAHAEDAVAAFEKLILTATQSTASANPIWHNPYTKKWVKKRFAVLDVKYDVKKTDSLLNPIIGIVSFKFFDDFAQFDTKEEAERGEFITQKIINTNYRKVSLTYSHKNDKWSFKDGGYETVHDVLSKYDLASNNVRFTEAEIIAKYAEFTFWLP